MVSYFQVVFNEQESELPIKWPFSISTDVFSLHLFRWLRKRWIRPLEESNK